MERLGGTLTGQVRPSFSGTENAAQTSIESQLQKLARLAASAHELCVRMEGVNKTLRGQRPLGPEKGIVEKEPELTLVNVVRAIEIGLERCHDEVTETLALLA
jgi:hypothetical protein